ncbi:hypothetical protein ACKXGD_17140, partial [Enterococcus lactis]|uniref:hypothetical protein n=1 Tax=Enterococcus lactis TaxID=357441 RepID=UPI003908069F
TQLETMAQLGISSINLTSNSQKVLLADGSSIIGETTFTKTDGSTGIAADTTFVYDTNGYLVQTTTTHNADGSTTLDSKGRNSDGRLAY